MDLTPTQALTLQKLLGDGFKFITIEHVERYLGVEKNGFVALLDPSEGRLSVYGQVGYRLGEGIGVLVEGGAGKRFVWKKDSVVASPELLAAYERFKAELQGVLQGMCA